MASDAGLKGLDVPLDRLAPLQTREVHKRGYSRLRASIRTLGLIEPLCVYEEDGKYTILDGYLRYRVCEELGIRTVPCLVLPTREAYTPNRMVNPLTPVQENRMLSKALGTLSDETIAKALGLASIKHR